ncbi:hypothetical protein HU200_049142 [Digitaria exilis]|uniref:Uncharacterized protein n=1 Tax=Digitaria exilis TaxID=1010633 RepID=A0A835B0C4_9POAL|nr:hypothetical protein HU200_052454 [Digitaria exilis]KAF8672917.1 hypothetical protein HU200_049142 [Digitaria exilis]
MAHCTDAMCPYVCSQNGYNTNRAYCSVTITGSRKCCCPPPDYRVDELV